MPPVDLPADDGVAVAVYMHSVLAQGTGPGRAARRGAAALEHSCRRRATAGRPTSTRNAARVIRRRGICRASRAGCPTPLNCRISGSAAAGSEAQRSHEPAEPARCDGRDHLAATGPRSRRPTRANRRLYGGAHTRGRPRGRRFAGSAIVPKVEIHDPLAAHKQLLQTYTDRDIHDVTAYLVTLK